MFEARCVCTSDLIDCSFSFLFKTLFNFAIVAFVLIRFERKSYKFKSDSVPSFLVSSHLKAFESIFTCVHEVCQLFDSKLEKKKVHFKEVLQNSVGYIDITYLAMNPNLEYRNTFPYHVHVLKRRNVEI